MRTFSYAVAVVVLQSSLVLYAMNAENKEERIMLGTSRGFTYVGRSVLDQTLYALRAVAEENSRALIDLKKKCVEGKNYRILQFYQVILKKNGLMTHYGLLEPAVQDIVNAAVIVTPEEVLIHQPSNFGSSRAIQPSNKTIELDDIKDSSASKSADVNCDTGAGVIPVIGASSKDE